MRRPTKILLWVLIGVPVLLLLAAVLWTAAMKSRFDAKLDEYRASGEPITLEALQGPEIPDEQNAAISYREAAAALRALPEEKRSRFKALWVKWPWTPEDVQEAQALLADMGEVLRLIREGAAKPGCRYAAEPGKPFALPGWVADTNELCVPLRLAAMLHRSTEDAAAAAEDCRLLLTLTASEATAPSSSGPIYAMMHGSAALPLIEKLLNAGEVPEASLRALINALGDTDSRDGEVRYVKAYRAELLELYHGGLERAGLLGFSLVGIPDAEGAKPTFICRATLSTDATWALGMMDRLTAVSARPAWETKADWETLTREIKDRCSNTWIYGTSNSLLKSLLGPLEYLARHRAQKACTKAAILLRLFRMKHVTYPETLDTLASELVGKPLVDPFSGKGLMYRRDGNGFIIYSVGPNGADDGGAKTSSGPADDVAVKVER